MTNLVQTKAILDAARRLHSAVQKQANMIAKAPDYTQVTQNRMNAHNTSLTWLAMQIDKDEFALHTAIVRAAICPAYPDDYYVTTQHRPSAFHTYDFHRPHPLAAHRNAKAGQTVG